MRPKKHILLTDYVLTAQLLPGNAFITEQIDYSVMVQKCPEHMILFGYVYKSSSKIIIIFEMPSSTFYYRCHCIWTTQITAFGVM